MDQKTFDIDAVADYICAKSLEAREDMTVLKLHKLVYYAQAWHLALYGSRLMDTEFEAWVHGPVNRGLFIRFRHGGDPKSMYSSITEADLNTESIKQLSEPARDHIDNVLDTYGHLTGSQLEQLTHREDPWLKTRAGLEPYQPCTKSISDELMKEFYSRLTK